MPHINNPRIIMLGNVKTTGEAFIKNDKKTGHEILFLIYFSVCRFSINNI